MNRYILIDEYNRTLTTNSGEVVKKVLSVEEVDWEVIDVLGYHQSAESYLEEQGIE